MSEDTDSSRSRAVSFPTHVPIRLTHNLSGDKFVWLWAKYVNGVNDRYHCTNCIRGPYSKRLSKHNRDLAIQPEIAFDEVAPNEFKAIYICGVSNNGYSRKANYVHNLHAAVLQKPGHNDCFTFENWVLSVENGLFLPIPKEKDIPEVYTRLPAAFTTCRIFRWAVVSGSQLCCK